MIATSVTVITVSVIMITVSVTVITYLCFQMNENKNERLQKMTKEMKRGFVSHVSFGLIDTPLFTLVLLN